MYFYLTDVRVFVGCLVVGNSEYIGVKASVLPYASNGEYTGLTLGYIASFSGSRGAFILSSAVGSTLVCVLISLQHKKLPLTWGKQ